MIEILITGYLVCSVAAYGMLVHLLQTTYPCIAHRDRVVDRLFAGGLSILGPMALVAAIWQLWSEGCRWGWRL